MDMEDTSFAIRPERHVGGQATSERDIGDMLGYRSEGECFVFRCTNGYVGLRFYASDIMRIVMNVKHEPEWKSSPALIMEPESVQLGIEETEQKLVISSTDLIASIRRSPFRIRISDSSGRAMMVEGELGMAWNGRGEVICRKEMDVDDSFYGLGEKTGFLNKRGERYTMWNTDVYAPHNPEIDALYVSIPYYMTLRRGRAHGVFLDNTYKTVFDMKTSAAWYSFGAEGGQLDYYVFAGPTPKDVVRQYTRLTGRMPLPPKWALGYHQSRYSYETEREVRTLVDTFRAKRIPCDAVHLDIHHMNQYRAFTFNREAFPDPAGLVADLRQMGFRIVPIVDPGVKVDPEYEVYREGVTEQHFCKYLEGGLFYGEVWPGKSAFPDFTNAKTQAWWGHLYRFYTGLGIEGIWNDMNEPAVFNETKTMDIAVMHENEGQPKTHRELHNTYGMRMAEATYKGMKKLLTGRRPFVLTRAGYAGIQRYAAVWTGDNRSFWEHLSMAVPMCLNLGLSGVPFCGADVGGFAHDVSPELLIRWTQMGACTPFFRNHSALGTVRQEPWAFDGETERLVTRYIELRYRLLPYLYTLFAEASESGLPVMRPLFMEYPEDARTYSLSDQFMLGTHMMVAPVDRPGIRERMVYLPPGAWYDYWTDEVHNGGRYIVTHAELDTLPLFINAGAVFAEGAVKQSTNEPDQHMTFHIYLPPDRTETAAGTFYDDDGETFAYETGVSFHRTVESRVENNIIYVQLKDRGLYTVPWKQWSLCIHGADAHMKLVINDRLLDRDPVVYDYTRKTLSLMMRTCYINHT